MDPKPLKTRGMLNEARSLKTFSLDQFAPPEDLADIVAWFWLVRWNLRDGETYRQSNLPHPVQHLVVDPQRQSGLFGCTSGRFDYDLSGSGAVLAARFHPAAASAIYDGAMNNLTDDFQEFTLPTEHPSPDMIVPLADVIRDIRAPLSSAALEARTIVELIEQTPTLLRVADVVKETGTSIRKLQRLFTQYTGVSPKWVIDRYRMFEAVDALNNSRDVNLAELALRLEYSDQAHFNKQFKKITGTSPGAYMSRQA